MRGLRTWIAGFVDRKPELLLYLATFLLVAGMFFGFVYLSSPDFRLRRIVSDLRQRTLPPGGHVLEAGGAPSASMWTVECDMPWEDYCLWVTEQLRESHAVTRPSQQVIEAVRDRFGDRYGLRIQRLDTGSGVRASVDLRISAR